MVSVGLVMSFEFIAINNRHLKQQVRSFDLSPVSLCFSLVVSVPNCILSMENPEPALATLRFFLDHVRSGTCYLSVALPWMALGRAVSLKRCRLLHHGRGSFRP